MTLEEIAGTLPNGFHDAEVSKIAIDLERRIIHLDMDLWVAESDDEDPETYRTVQVSLTGVDCFAIEPPHSHDYSSRPGRIVIDGGSGDPGQARWKLPETGAPHHWFFVRDWNAFILVAAREAQLKWTGDKRVRDHAAEQ